MKKELIVLGAALALAGCSPQGGTGTDTDTASGSASSSSSTTIVTNNGPSVSGTVKIDTNQPPKSQGSSSSESSSKSSSQSSPQ